jgi:hypothetical protein
MTLMQNINLMHPHMEAIVEVVVVVNYQLVDEDEINNNKM